MFQEQPKLSGFVKAEREKVWRFEFIFLDAGDGWLEGDLTGDRTRGENVLEFYKMIGMDAVTLGTMS